MGFCAAIKERKAIINLDAKNGIAYYSFVTIKAKNRLHFSDKEI